MFKASSFFRISPDFVLPPLEALETALQAARFLPCGPTQPDSHGWVPPRGKKSEVLAESVGGHLILKLQTEKRALPASAVRAAVEERIEKYKLETGQERVGGKIKKAFKEEVILDLLPRAFTKRSTMLLWLDPVGRFLVVDTGSLSGADRIVTALVEALAGIPGSNPSIGLKPVQTQMTAATSMAHWLSTREAPWNFTVDQDCELKTPDEQKSTVRYARHTLEIDEVAEHIAQGKLPTRLALTWNERVSFELTESAQIRKIKLLDVVMDGQSDKGKDDDGFDADAAILTGELSGLIPDLLEALGGEMEEGAAPAAAAPAATREEAEAPF